MQILLGISLIYSVFHIMQTFDTCLSLQLYVSRKWGFTKFDRDVYEKWRAEGRLLPCGVHASYIREHGPLQAWKNRASS